MESKSLLFPCMGFPLPKVPLPEAGAGGKREDRMLKMKGCESGRDWDNLSVKEEVDEVLGGEEPEKIIP